MHASAGVSGNIRGSRCGMAKSDSASAVKRAGVSGLNKPKATPSNPHHSHVVVTRCNGKVKTVRFGQHGVRGAGKHPSSAKEKRRRKSFKARHAKNISKGPCSAAYWANKVKW